MAMITCPNCGEQISDKAKSCVHCGVSLQPEEKMVCEECGAELEGGIEICPACGCPVAKSGEEATDVPQQVEVTGVRMTKKAKKSAACGWCDYSDSCGYSWNRNDSKKESSR